MKNITLILCWFLLCPILFVVFALSVSTIGLIPTAAFLFVICATAAIAHRLKK